MSIPKGMFTPVNHDRDSAGLQYVYPVLSRRAGGVSIGINLNPNNACNWRCIYCQVPNLQRGTAPPIDMAILAAELRGFIENLPAFMEDRVPEAMRRLNDIALSGNGEPTSAAEFPAVIALIGQVKLAAHLEIKTVLITNGSLTHRPAVQAGLVALASQNGEVWFKLDRATAEGVNQVNQTRISPKRMLAQLIHTARLCPTWVQSCFFLLDGEAPTDIEINAYVNQLHSAAQHAPLAGVLLYTVARPSMQVEAPRIAPVSEAWLAALATRLSAIGLPTKVSV